MAWRTCGKCKNEFFAEYKHCPGCGQEYKENHLKAFSALAAVAFLLVSAIVYEFYSVSKTPDNSAEQDLIQKEDTARLEEMMSKLPDTRKLEEEKVRIEERISQLSKKLALIKQQQKRTVNIDGVMTQISGERPPEQETAAIDDLVSEMPEAKQLKEEEARLEIVMNQMAEIRQLHNKKTRFEERAIRFSQARQFLKNNLDATNEELVAIKNSLESFKTTEDEYQEVQKLLVFINEKIAVKSKKIDRKNQAIERERFEAETASLDDKGKRLKKEHPNWSVEECDLISKGKIKTGMLEEQVKVALGEPFEIKRTSTRSKWILRKNSTACLYFEEGICVAIQQ
ncbi:hypothetical protein EPN96_10960 [bacterium]|nr:MAG: hypothetical protein EPN96_10960 [bacterium]